MQGQSAHMCLPARGVTGGVQFLIPGPVLRTRAEGTSNKSQKPQSSVLRAGVQALVIFHSPRCEEKPRARGCHIGYCSSGRFFKALDLIFLSRHSSEILCDTRGESSRWEGHRDNVGCSLRSLVLRQSAVPTTILVVKGVLLATSNWDRYSLRCGESLNLPFSTGITTVLFPALEQHRPVTKLRSGVNKASRAQEAWKPPEEPQEARCELPCLLCLNFQVMHHL